MRFRAEFLFKTAFSVPYFSLCEQVGSENARLQTHNVFVVFSEPVFLFVWYFSLCRSVGCFGQLRSLRSLKALRAFGFPHQPIFFFVIASLCFSVFLFCFAFLSWAPPTPARFLKKAWQKLLRFWLSAFCFLSLCSYF